MTDAAFRAFLAALLHEMNRVGQDPSSLEADESGTQARLIDPRHEPFVILRKHLEAVPGTPAQVAAAVYSVYLADAVAS